MLTTSRPELGPKEGVAYCYLGGTIYYGDSTHPMLAMEMVKEGIPKSAMAEGIWGYVWNGFERDGVPHYVNEVYSDFFPTTPKPEDMANLQAKLEAVFPGIRTAYGREDVQRWLDHFDKDPNPYEAKWTFNPTSAILSAEMSTSTIDAAIQADPAATTAIQALTEAGGRVFVVGGAVRDSALGKSPKDVDLMVSGLEPEAIEAALSQRGKVDFTGKQFGVYRFRIGGSEVEIALPRTEVSTGPGHQDFQVSTDPYLAPEADLARRDFTGNAMAYDPTTGELIDPHGGAAHLDSGTLSLVNDKAFEDDPLRIVRALVANARFGLEPDDELRQALKDNAQKIRHLPGERVQMELDKLLSSDNPAQAIELAEESGLVDYLFPELSNTVGFDQKNPFHDLDVFSHTMMVLKAMQRLSNDPDMRLAALFHDSGKPDAFWQDETKGPSGGGHFYKKVEDDGSVLGADHEEVGADLVNAFMNRLRYPNDRIKRVTDLVKWHMFPYFDSEKGARRFLRALNGDVKMAFDLLTLREADAMGKRDGTMNDFDTRKLARSKELLQNVLEDEDAGFTLKDLAVNGHDMMALGLKGPEVGHTLNRLLDLVVDRPELNDKDTLIRLVEEAKND